ncbi:hypothetical protein ABZ930_30945 [Streptomyces sp. NPDC046716]|uniref:hypothetical protein n=1 Tax=Streptomyces sp. NPDC046716 TaxID=3157093 RepID=UPI0033D9243B
MNIPDPPEASADGSTGAPVVYVQPVDDQGTPLAAARALFTTVPVVPEPLYMGGVSLDRRDLMRRVSEQLSTGPVVVVQFLGHGVVPPSFPVGPAASWLASVTSGLDPAWESLALLDSCRGGAERADAPRAHADVLRAQLESARSRVILSGPTGADEWLETIRTPRTDVWREAAATVLLDEGWTPPGPDDEPVTYFKKRLRSAVRQWRGTWERQLNHRLVGLLSEPRFHGGEFVGTLADTLVSGADVEARALDALEVSGDPCVLQVMAGLSPRESRIAEAYARNPALSWQEAAALAGEPDPHRAGDSLSHRLLRLGRQHVERARAAGRTAGGLFEGCPHRLPTASLSGRNSPGQVIRALGTQLGAPDSSPSRPLWRTSHQERNARGQNDLR